MPCSHRPNVALLFLASIMLSAAWHGRGPSTLAAAASVAAFNFFLVPPRYTFEVAEPRYILTFTMMFGVGMVISSLASRLREQRCEVQAREAKTDALYALGRALAAAGREDDIARVLVAEVRRVFATEVEFVGGTEAVAASSSALAVSLIAGDIVHGVLVLTHDASQRPAIDVALLETFARQGATALARARAAADAALADRRARTEEVRSTLLSAVSHDLRTPLAVITGVASTLRDEHLDDAERTELLATLCDEAERLERLVGNLLDMTRLQAGAVVVRAQWVPLEEVVGSALARLERRLGDRPVQVVLAPELPLLSVDPILLEQVLVNLLDNAIKYAPDDQVIELRSFVRDNDVIIHVLDRGPGLPPELGVRAFDRFVRGDMRGRDGFGLGLAICREIVEIHGGTIRSEPRPGGGACFEIALPRSVDEPSPLVEESSARASA